jgi:hypothetical protein
MTEADLLQGVIGYASSGGLYFSIWLTVLSAYAVIAYLAGKDLTTFQTVWVNTLYLFGSLLSIMGFYGGYRSQLFYINKLKELNPESPQIMSTNMLLSVTGFAILVTMATLLFMWQVRHPKTE